MRSRLPDWWAIKLLAVCAAALFLAEMWATLQS